MIGEATPVTTGRSAFRASSIRQYQRGYDDEGEEVLYPIKAGFRFLEREFRRVVKEYVLMPEAYVHPLIVKTSFR